MSDCGGCDCGGCDFDCGCCDCGGWDCINCDGGSCQGCNSDCDCGSCEDSKDQTAAYQRQPETPVASPQSDMIVIIPVKVEQPRREPETDDLSPRYAGGAVEERYLDQQW